MNKGFVDFIIRKSEKSEFPRTYANYAAGVVGLLSNLFLAIVKLVFGILSHSVSLMADAINNFTDAASSFIVIIGSFLASRPSDENHPYGHGRVEYIAGMVVSVIVLYVGLSFAKRSVERILNPEIIRTDSVLFAVLIISIFIKIWQSDFNRVMGERIRSTTLKAVASDAMSDVLITGVVALGLFLGRFTSFPVDGVVGLLVAAGICRNAIELIKETTSPLLGEKPDDALVQGIVKIICENKCVLGYHDLMFHEYGPSKRLAVVDMEFDSNMGLIEVHDIIDQIEREVYNEYGVNLVAAIDPKVLNSPEMEAMENFCRDISKSCKGVIDIHDWQLLKSEGKRNLINFDIGVDGNLIKTACEVNELTETVQRKVTETYTDFKCIVNVDRQFKPE